MIPSAPIEDIILYTYLTGYNIQDIYSIITGINNCELLDFLSNNKLNSSLLHSKKESDLKKLIEKAKKDRDIAVSQLVYYDIKPVPYYSNIYPKYLLKLSDPPPIIYAKGEILNKPLAAIVGTRDVSSQAEHITNGICSELTSLNVGIVSGLALGIDTLAHNSAITNQGYTIAVMPNSLDSVYPKENYGLASRIINSGGALISELIFNINRGKKSFVERNRIQSALSDLVVPIEMMKSSGTMHTINFAKAQRKKIILLMPHSSWAELPQYEGINYLLSLQTEKPKENVLVAKSMTIFKEQVSSIFGGDKFTGKQLELF